MDTQNDVITTTTSGGNNSRALSEAFTASETVNLIEKRLKACTKGTTGNIMMQKFTSLVSLVGVPVKLSNGIVDENNNQTDIHR